MSRVSTYLNFVGQTEEAFGFYGSSRNPLVAGGIVRMGDMPGGPAPELPEADKNLVAT